MITIIFANVRIEKKRSLRRSVKISASHASHIKAVFGPQILVVTFEKYERYKLVLWQLLQLICISCEKIHALHMCKQYSYYLSYLTGLLFCVVFGAFSVGFWGSAPDPDGGAFSAPPYPLAGREGCPLPHPPRGHGGASNCALPPPPPPPPPPLSKFLDPPLIVLPIFHAKGRSQNARPRPPSATRKN